MIGWVRPLPGEGAEGLVDALAHSEVVVDVSACPGYFGHALAEATCRLALVAQIDFSPLAGRARAIDEVSAAVVQNLSCARGRRVEWFLVDPGRYDTASFGPISDVLRLAIQDGLVSRGGLAFRGFPAEATLDLGPADEVFEAVMADPRVTVTATNRAIKRLARGHAQETFEAGITPVYEVSTVEELRRLPGMAAYSGASHG